MSAESQPGPPPPDASNDIAEESRQYFEARARIASGETAQEMREQAELDAEDAHEDEDGTEDGPDKEGSELPKGHSILSDTERAQEARARINQLWSTVPDSAYGPTPQEVAARKSEWEKEQRATYKANRPTRRESVARTLSHFKPRLPKFLRRR